MERYTATIEHAPTGLLGIRMLLADGQQIGWIEEIEHKPGTYYPVQYQIKMLKSGNILKTQTPLLRYCDAINYVKNLFYRQPMTDKQIDDMLADGERRFQEALENHDYRL